MYNEYFGLKELPFSIAPDPRYLFMSEKHREALAHLLYGFSSNGGFVLLTGEVGTGKTTVCRCLLEQLPESTALAFILNPKLTAHELLAAICDEFGIAYPSQTSIKTNIDLINKFLLEASSSARRAVLIIDEAQNLSPEVLEQLRLLTNLETNKEKLLQVILIGQPELRDKLSRPELRQLSQRIIARYHLGSLSKNEVRDYVYHRLSVAGIQENLFPSSTIRKLFNLSGGIPRVINVLCDRALLGTYTQNLSTVNSSTLNKASREVFGELPSKTPHNRNAALWIASFIILILVGAVLARTYYDDHAADLIESEYVSTVSEDQSALAKLTRPSDLSVNESYEHAFETILSLWNKSSTFGSTPLNCENVPIHNLQCYKGLGSLNSLTSLNRPAVLKLSDPLGGFYYAALTGIEDSTATVIVGTDLQQVSTETLLSAWLGEFTMLWQSPSDYKVSMKPGDQNTLVLWLQNRLSSINGVQYLQTDNFAFNSSLVQDVKRFQMSRGIKPDGIVGPNTLIHINTLTDTDIPFLLNVKKDL